jgi:WD40 repeat protein
VDGAQVITGSWDGLLTLSRGGESAPVADLPGLMARGDARDRISALAVSPDGTMASSDFGGAIRLWDRSLKPLRVVVPSGARVNALSFSPDGRYLLAAGELAGHARIFDLGQGKVSATYPGHSEPLLGAAFSPDGRLAATAAASGDIHIWDAQKATLKVGMSGIGRAVASVGFAADGRSIAWGNWLNRPLERSLALIADPSSQPMALVGEAAESYQRAEAAQRGWSLAAKAGSSGTNPTLEIVHDGKVEARIESSNDHFAYSFTPDGQAFVSGGSAGRLAAYDLAGRWLGDFIGHTGAILAVAVSPDGRYLLSGSHDQTMKLWNLRTRELIVTIFAGRNGEWIMFTPQGAYVANAAGAVLFGAQLNRGLDQDPDVINPVQLRVMNRPDIVHRALELGSAVGAIAEVSSARQ